MANVISNVIETTEEVGTDDLAIFFKEGRMDYGDSDILHISKQLQKINITWSQVPRTYIVLRRIGKVNLDNLINLGFTDLWFPVREKSLPDFLGATTKSKFVKAQASILTKSWNLEKGEEGTHMHFANGEITPFESVGKLGSGGFGSVDRVLSQMTQNEYARKLIRRKDLFEPAREIAKSYIRELEVLKRIKHHIVELVGSYTDAQYLGLIMSPVADGDLRNYLAEAPFPDGKRLILLSFFGRLAAALAYLHGKNIRHKDIKLENILIKGKMVLFTDFGIS